MSIVNVDNSDESVSFRVPFKPIEPIVSNAGKQVTNEMQALGSSITYMRRYLYMIALDICEPDEIDGRVTTQQATQPTTPVVAPQVTTPATIKIAPTEDKPLTDAKGNASEIQIKQLKTVLKQLKDADPTKEELIAKIAVETNGFTVISKADCEALTLKILQMLDKGDK